MDALRPPSRFASGDRIGIAWLRGTCGRCRWCLRGAENLCPEPGSPAGTPTAATPSTRRCRRRSPTGCRDLDDVELRPAAVRGIIGYRALRRAELPPGGRLGIYGFGATAHLVAQVAMAQGDRARADPLRGGPRAGLELGAAVGGPADAASGAAGRGGAVRPGRRAGAGGAAALDQGGTLAVAGIHLSDIPRLHYGRPPVPGALDPARTFDWGPPRAPGVMGLDRRCHEPHCRTPARR